MLLSSRKISLSAEHIKAQLLTFRTWLTFSIDCAFPSHFSQDTRFFLIYHRTDFIMILIISSSFRPVSSASHSRSRCFRFNRDYSLHLGSRCDPFGRSSFRRLRNHFTHFGLIRWLCCSTGFLTGSQRRSSFAFSCLSFFQLTFFFVERKIDYKTMKIRLNQPIKMLDLLPSGCSSVNEGDVTSPFSTARDLLRLLSVRSF